jgi:hypothetical protein
MLLNGIKYLKNVKKFGELTAVDIPLQCAS